MDANEEFEDVRSKEVADLKQGGYDGVTFPDDQGYMWFPVQLMVEENSQHLDSRRRIDSLA